MSTLKRKTIDNGLQRRVRARREPSEEPEPIPSINGDEEGEEEESSDNSTSGNNKDDDEEVSIVCRVYPYP